MIEKVGFLPTSNSLQYLIKHYCWEALMVLHLKMYKKTNTLTSWWNIRTSTHLVWNILTQMFHVSDDNNFFYFSNRFEVYKQHWLFWSSPLLVSDAGGVPAERGERGCSESSASSVLHWSGADTGVRSELVTVPAPANSWEQLRLIIAMMMISENQWWEASIYTASSTTWQLASPECKPLNHISLHTKVDVLWV